MRILRSDVDRVAILTVTGELNSVSAPVLRQAVLKAFTDQPLGVVVDLAQVPDMDLSIGALLLSLSTQAQTWPGVPLAFAGPTQPVEAKLRRIGLHDRLLIRDDLLAAIADARNQQDNHVRHLLIRLPCLPHAASEARGFVGDACRRYPPEAAQAAVLVANELVTHVLLHSGVQDRLTVYLVLNRQAIRLSVTGTEPGRGGGPGESGAVAARAVSSGGSRPPPPELTLLLDRLTARWGILPARFGATCTWCLFRTPGAD